MTVMVCIPCLLTGGTEIQTLSLVEALVAAEHRPVVACYFEYADEMVKRYRQAGAEVELMSAEGRRPVGVKDTIIHLWRGFRRVVKQYRPDVAHVQYMAPGALPVFVLRAMGIRKIIATSHTASDIYSPKGLRIIRFLTNHVLTSFQCITLLAERSYFGTANLFRHDSPLQRHFTIYNNIPSHIAITGTPRKFEFQRLTVGVVSRLERIKGMDLVVPAFAIAVRKNPGLHLLVVGEGSLRGLMESQAIESRLNDRVDFVGRQPQSQLQNYYDRIDLLLMPSRSEGFGLTAIEGMARGCVPVVADTGGLPEVVTPDCGFLHRTSDINDLADKITEATSNPEIFSRLSTASVARVALFSADTYRTVIKGLYSKLEI